MELILNNSKNEFGIKVDQISFSFLNKALKSIPNLSIKKSKYNALNDDALIEFTYNDFEFEVFTPLSDYWIEKPSNCPDEIFNEIIIHLQEKKIRW